MAELLKDPLGFGSRKRVAETLGNLPELLAASFEGNLVILHFDE